MFVPVKTPQIIKSLFFNYTWDINASDKTIYLTFDDGPTPEITEWVLDVLEQYNAKASFFCLGKNVKSNPEVFKKVVEKGHAIGNHSYSHISGWKITTKTYLKDVKEAEKYIKGGAAKLFRPPYGQIRFRQGKKLIKRGYKIIMWDVIAFDWDNTITEKECYNNVISNAKKGSIVVLHDSVKASKNLKYTLPKVLEYFSKKGFAFKALSS